MWSSLTSREYALARPPYQFSRSSTTATEFLIKEDSFTSNKFSTCCRYRTKTCCQKSHSETNALKGVLACGSLSRRTHVDLPLLTLWCGCLVFLESAPYTILKQPRFLFHLVEVLVWRPLRSDLLGPLRRHYKLRLIAAQRDCRFWTFKYRSIFLISVDTSLMLAFPFMKAAASCIHSPYSTFGAWLATALVIDQSSASFQFGSSAYLGLLQSVPEVSS